MSLLPPAAAVDESSFTVTDGSTLEMDVSLDDNDSWARLLRPLSVLILRKRYSPESLVLATVKFSLVSGSNKYAAAVVAAPDADDVVPWTVTPVAAESSDAAAATSADVYPSGLRAHMRKTRTASLDPD